MKKILLFSMGMVLMAGGAAFAQLANGNYFGARGLFTFVPLEAQTVYEPAGGRDTDRDVTAAVGQYWGGQYGRIELKFRGQNNYMGYRGEFLTDTGNFRFGEANVWIKPASWLKLTVGQFSDDYLRGKSAGDDLNNFVLSTGTEDFSDDDVIFHLFHGGDANNAEKWGAAMLTLTPISNLYIGLGLPDGFRGISSDATSPASGGGGQTAKQIYSRIQAGAGYKIDGVGHIRAQYVGKPEYDLSLIAGTMTNGNTVSTTSAARFKHDFQRVEAAFAYTGLNNMILDLGLKYAFPVADTFAGGIDATYSPGFVFGASFQMNMGDLGLKAHASGSFGGGYKISGGPVSHEYSRGAYLNFHLIPSYNIGFGIVGLNMGMDITGKDTADGGELETNRINFGLGGSFRKYLGADCFFIAGLTYTFLGVTGDGDRPKDSVSGYFRVPIIIEVNFQ